MQTEIPVLPVVHFNGHKNLDRTQNSNLGKSVKTKCSLPPKNITCLSSKKKNLHPLLGQPYQVHIRPQHSSEHSKLDKNSIGQRVLSAKMLRIKELQNQLADAHYRLNELSNENKLLKSLQKRQDSALKRYEGTNAELPRIINSHHEELRILQVKYKKLKALQKETRDLLKEKENELQQLQCQNKHLLRLSEDRNLEEREKLQLQVSDLNHRIQQQQDTIQTLHRKLILESKSLKHQLHAEVCKRKGVQKNLDEAIEKLRSLETLLDNRERRLYSSGQLLAHGKNRRLGTQSLTNLRDISSSDPLKLSDRYEKWQTGVQNNNTLSVHITSELNGKDMKADEKVNSNRTLNSIRTETMANLAQVRKYRLQKSSHKRTSSDDSEEKFKEPDFAANANSMISVNLENLQELRKQEENINWQYKRNADKFQKIYENQKYRNIDKTSEKELTDSSVGSGSENDSENLIKNNYINEANSRQLHRRLISNTDDILDLKALTFSEYKEKFEMQEIKNSYKSDLETEFQLQKESIENHFAIDNQNDALKLISSINDDQVCYDSDKEIKKLTTSTSMLNESREDTNSGNVEKYILEQTKRQDYSDTTQSEFETESLLHTLESKGEEWNENAASYLTYNELESRMPYVRQNCSKSLQITSINNPLNVSNSIDEKQVMNEMKANKNILLESCDVETKNKLNKQEEILSDVTLCGNNLGPDVSVDVNTTNKIDAKLKPNNYIKQQLLASMKAIDDNENIEFLSKDYKKHNTTNRKQITENLFHGLPTGMKKKQDIIKDIFDTDVVQNESIG